MNEPVHSTNSGLTPKQTEAPIFKASLLGNRTEVYQDRLVYKGFFGILAEINVPISEISSVNLGAIWMPGAMVETSGGQKYGLYVPFSKKKGFLKTISDLKNSGADSATNSPHE